MVRRWRQIGGRTSPGQLFAFHYMKCPELGENRPCGRNITKQLLINSLCHNTYKYFKKRKQLNIISTNTN